METETTYCPLGCGRPVDPDYADHPCETCNNRTASLRLRQITAELAKVADDISHETWAPAGNAIDDALDSIDSAIRTLEGDGE